jgi:hypothetical protein
MTASTSKLWVQGEIGEYEEWSVENIEDREAALKEYVMDMWTTPSTRLSGVTEPESAISQLTKHERYVLRALCETPGGGARRVIHRTAGDFADSPFENPESNGTERSTVGSILARLTTVGLAEQDQSTWYPSDVAKTVDVEL